MSRRLIHIYHEHAELLTQRVCKLAPDAAVVELRSAAELAAALPEIEVLFAPNPPRQGWAGASRLRLIQVAGVGVDHFLPAPDLPAHVEVAGMRGAFAAEVAEYVVAGMLMLCRRSLALWRAQAARRFEQGPVGRLAGKRVVIYGVGAIGRRVARVAGAMDMDVVGVCRTARSIEHVRVVHSADGLATAVADADYLAVTVALTPETRGSVDAALLARMPRGAGLVNAARGGIVDETALVDALQGEQLSGAVLDAFETEPLSPDSPLWDAPNTIVTPHVAGYGYGYLTRAAGMLLENVRRLDADQPRLHLVDRQAGY